MRQSKAELYFHLVWGTWRRLPLVLPGIERAVYRCIEGEAKKLRCKVLGVNGMPDHVHLAVKAPAVINIPKLMQQVKGNSSTRVRKGLRPDELFGWQDGYAVYSVCPRHIQHIIQYIENQKQHHYDGTTVDEWEETDEEYLPEPSPET